MNNIEISIIIPVYQSSLSLKGLFDDIQNLLQNNFKNYELILVNDNSSDNSWDIIKSLCEKNSWVKGINLRKNVGQHNATFVGLKHAIGLYHLKKRRQSMSDKPKFDWVETSF